MSEKKSFIEFQIFRMKQRNAAPRPIFRGSFWASTANHSRFSALTPRNTQFATWSNTQWVPTAYILQTFQKQAALDGRVSLERQSPPRVQGSYTKPGQGGRPQLPCRGPPQPKQHRGSTQGQTLSLHRLERIPATSTTAIFLPAISPGLSVRLLHTAECQPNTPHERVISNIFSPCC